jgi:hypothetical protein
MSSIEERILVGAALYKIATGADEDGEAVKIVIAYGSKLKKSLPFEVGFSSYDKSNGSPVSAHTQEHGQVTIRDEREKNIEKSFGVHKERIGLYRLWKDREGLLRFHHFWKSDMTTSNGGKKPPEFAIGYNKKSLAMKYIGVLCEKKISFHLWPVEFSVELDYFKPIYDTKKIPLSVGDISFRFRIVM